MRVLLLLIGTLFFYQPTYGCSIYFPTLSELERLNSDEQIYAGEVISVNQPARTCLDSVYETESPLVLLAFCEMKNYRVKMRVERAWQIESPETISIDGMHGVAGLSLKCGIQDTTPRLGERWLVVAEGASGIDFHQKGELAFHLDTKERETKAYEAANKGRERLIRLKYILLISIACSIVFFWGLSCFLNRRNRVFQIKCPHCGKETPNASLDCIWCQAILTSPKKKFKFAFLRRDTP